jgi:hypothetical protein
MTNNAYLVQNAYINLINSNITDPNSDRVEKGTKWVYDDTPSSTMGPANYPRISVLRNASPVEPHEVGSSSQRIKQRIEVQIRASNKLKFSGKTTSQFIEELAAQISSVITSKTIGIPYLLANAGVFQIELESESSIFVNDLEIKTQIYKNIFKR